MKLAFSTPRYVLATGLVSIGGFLNGYDTGSIGAVTEMPHFTQTIGTLSPFLRGFTVSLILLTGGIPSLLAGQLADKWGRLSVISAGALVFVLGAILQGAANKLVIFMVGRAICGVGEGLWLSCVIVYVTEIAPSARRGMLVSVPQLMTAVGICSGYFTCYASVRLESDMSWRAPYIIQAIFASILATTRLVLPQSPRWLLLHGHRDKAIQELKRLDFSAVEAEKDLLGPAAEQRIMAKQPGPVEGLLMIFRKPYRKQTLLALYVLGFIQLSGIDGVLYYAPTLFNQAGISAKTSSFLASGLSAILILLISIPALLFVDKVSRRTSMTVGGIVLTTCMFTIGSLYASDSVHPNDGSARWVVIILVFVFGLAYSSTWAIVGRIYASEIQPAATRSAASCVAQGFGFFTNWIVAIITPVLLAESSFGAYFLFGGICFLSVVVLMFTMPETRGQSLEAIEAAFKRPSAESGKVVSLLRKWVGSSGNSRVTGTVGSDTANESAIELRDVGGLLDAEGSNEVDASSVEMRGGGTAVRTL